MSALDPARLAGVLKDYLRELALGNVDAVLALFAPQARIYSPLLGWVSPAPFYRQLAAASGNSRITLRDIGLSVQGAPRAMAYFRYDWVLKDGCEVSFDCVDVFDFDPDGLIGQMVIVYDTYPIRGDLGDRFQLAGEA
ncbi:MULTISPECIES: nuclear transport factor 2 family protein [unclassified Paludibacterium]|uniref:nuclear transport factor 2 family protein n=1 Tax=unclassified Paludibacterium TaxID=2618429 RepID=UPI001C041F9D|nr:nuclear transport factor 2 family protein [Paludibacterium sp. B53371]BEV72953.1 nuclear transport factor 2 family protein [Paludibacterium sp. THUN1379]